MNWKEKNAEIVIYVEFKGLHNIIQVCCCFFLLSHELYHWYNSIYIFLKISSFVTAFVINILKQNCIITLLETFF